MPGKPLTAPAFAAVIGLTGKLPAHGDFVRRGDARATAQYDRWLTLALEVAATSDRDALSEQMSAMPAWRFVTVDDVQVVVGAMVVSHDKVGRIYPLIGFAILPEASQAQAEAWAARAEAVLAEARDACVTADGLSASLSGIPIVPDPDPEPPRTSWWRVTDAVRLDGPGSALPTGDEFARLLSNDDRDVVEQGTGTV